MPDNSPDALPNGAPPLEDLAGTSLFLDFDGTLVEIAAKPDAVVFDDSLAEMLDRLCDRMPGRVGIISGRSIAQLERFMGNRCHHLAIAGSHGAEHRTPGGDAKVPERPAALDHAAEAFLEMTGGDDRMMTEIKSFGVAIHYRGAPEREDEAVALAKEVAERHDLQLQHGKMMAEVRTPGDKGAALRALMELPGFNGTRPLFFGDDVTDEDAFEAAEALGGAGVLIGKPRPSAARYCISSVTSLRRWLGEALGATA